MFKSLVNIYFISEVMTIYLHECQIKKCNKVELNRLKKQLPLALNFIVPEPFTL